MYVTTLSEDMLKLAMVEAFVDELQKIAEARGHMLSPAEVERMLKEAGVMAMMGAGLKRGVQAAGRGISNQARSLNYHVGNAISQANPHALLNPTMPVPGIGAAISGGVNYAASKMPQKLQSIAQKGIDAAVPSHNPMTFGASQAVGHAINQFAPGLGGIAGTAIHTGITKAMPMIAKRVAPQVGNTLQHVMSTSI